MTVAEQIAWFKAWTQGKAEWSDDSCEAILASLRSLEAQSEEVRRLRSDIQTAVDLLLAFNKDAHARNPMAVTAIDEFLAYRGLGSQP